MTKRAVTKIFREDFAFNRFEWHVFGVKSRSTETDLHFEIWRTRLAVEAVVVDILKGLNKGFITDLVQEEPNQLLRAMIRHGSSYRLQRRDV